MTVFSPVNNESKSPALQPAAKLSDEQLGRVLGFADMVGDWIKSVEAEAYARAMRGVAPLGYKLVQGKSGNRKWDNEELAAKALGEEVFYEKCARSPAQVEKLLKAQKKNVDISLIVTQSPGKPTLVPIDDARPAIALTLPFTPITDPF